MAESKKTSSKGKAQSNAELAEQLRLAAEILDGASEQPTKASAKKPTAKKPTANKPSAKSGASKAPAKKPTTKTPTTKAAPKKEAIPEEKAVEQPVAEQQPIAEEKPAAAERPVVEEKPVEQPVAEQQPVEEKSTEQPVAEEKPEEQKAAVEQPVPTQPAPAPVAAKKSDAFMNKTSNFINNKGKFPLWIVANALLLLSSIFLLFGGFSIPTARDSIYAGKPISGTVFTYYGNATAIKANWQGTAGAWANGGYAMMGILMFFAFLVPLALVVKNVVLFALKKNKNVHMLDAIITFAFLIAYLGVVGMYGANITWSQVLSLIMSIILLAYTIFVILLENRGGMFPFFSIANIVLIMLCMFLLTNTIIYNGGGYYAAKAAAHSGGGGFAFIMLLIALAALVLLLVMQVKKLPGKIAWLFEFVVPATAGVCALIALISFAGGNGTQYGMGGGFVFGAILTLLFAAADVVFALVPKLHKYNVKVVDKIDKQTAPVVQPAATQPTADEQPAPQAQSATTEQPTEQPEPGAAIEQPAPADNGDKLTCPACGMVNGIYDVFCMKCGRKLK